MSLNLEQLVCPGVPASYTLEQILEDIAKNYSQDTYNSDRLHSGFMAAARSRLPELDKICLRTHTDTEVREAVAQTLKDTMLVK